jgi:hypothetical protein
LFRCTSNQTLKALARRDKKHKRSPDKDHQPSPSKKARATPAPRIASPLNQDNCPSDILQPEFVHPNQEDIKPRPPDNTITVEDLERPLPFSIDEIDLSPGPPDTAEENPAPSTSPIVQSSADPLGECQWQSPIT